MKKHSGKHRADGGGVSAKEIACGKASGVRSGSRSNMPPERLDRGYAEGKRKGTNAAALSMGKPGGRRNFATGGHASDMDFEPKGERLKKTRERDEILGSPHYAKGGKVHKSMKALYHALHSHFENEPQMKKLRATKSSVYDGEPHRLNKGKTMLPKSRMMRKFHP